MTRFTPAARPAAHSAPRSASHAAAQPAPRTGRRPALVLNTTLLCVLAALLSPTPGQAQSAPATPPATPAASVHHYDIAPGPLPQVLNQYLQAAGISMSFAAAALHGRHSPGVRGSHTVEGGLQQVLQGSGFAAVATGPGRYQLRAVPQPQATLLESVTVQGALTRDTEGQNSYTAGSMNTATPLNLSMRDTPQSVSVVTRDRLDDGAVQTVENALTYTTGMTVVASGQERPSYSARGFTANNLMIDGVAVDYDMDTFSSSGTAMYDRIEVVRGATGLLEGAGNPSASINLVLKKPTDTFQANASATVGSWHDYQGTADLSGPLNAAGSLRGRVVASAQHSDSFTEASGRKRQLLYGVLSADLRPGTTATVGAYYTRDDSLGAEYSGIPTRADGSFYDLPRDFRSSPAWSYWNKRNINLFAELSQTLAGGWQAELKGSHLRTINNLMGAAVWSLDAQGTYAFDTKNYEQKQDSTAFDARLSGPFALLGREHELSVGANYRHTTYLSWGGPALSFPYRFDPLNWQATIDLPEPTAWDLDNYHWQSKKIQYGAFAATRASLSDDWHLLLGARLSWFRFDDAMRSGTWQQATSYDAKREFTPYAALTYQLDAHHTVYGSLTRIFKPQNYVQANGGLLDPVEGTNREIGLKGEYLDGRLNASLAAFQIDQTNLPSQLPFAACIGLPTSCYEATGKVRSRGFEAELSGNLTEQWRVFLGYANVSARHVEDSSSGKAGDRYATTTPRHMVTLSTVYQFDGALRGWRAGASARVQSAIENTRSGYATVRQPGYGVFNLLLGYKPNAHLDVQLNLNNVFDRVYYRSVGSPIGGNLFGTPRQAVLTMRYQY